MCLLATSLSCAKTPEPIEMLFEAQTRWGRSDHVLGRGPDPLREGRFGGHTSAYRYLPVVGILVLFLGQQRCGLQLRVFSDVKRDQTLATETRTKTKTVVSRPVLSPDFTNSRCLSFPSLSNAFLPQVTQSLCTFPTQRLLLRVQ